MAEQGEYEAPRLVTRSYERPALRRLTGTNAAGKPAAVPAEGATGGLYAMPGYGPS